jgi:hypothetical protein
MVMSPVVVTSGQGGPGKSRFPKSWSEDKAMHAISDIATDPNLVWKQQTGPVGGDFTKLAILFALS